MARIHGDILIERPPEVVFDFLADERNEPHFNPRRRFDRPRRHGRAFRSSRCGVATLEG